MADHVITYRVVVKEIASKHGVYATFMPKPIFGQNGSGMHTHQSLFKCDKNAFFSADDKDNLSDVAKKFMAGLLKHAREMSSIFAQWVNSYKRLVPGYEAPVYVAWSKRNRSALIRVPQYHPGKEKAVRAEFRPPDPACNPYLTFAVMLHAGLDGIENNYELAAPLDKNLYDLSAEERKAAGIESLPDSLGEAISITENSEFVRKALGDHIFTRFVELKKKEWEDYRIQVTPGCGRICVALFRPYRAALSFCFLSQSCALGYPIAPRWGFAGSRHASPEGAGSPQPWATPRGACDPTIQALKERNDATPLRRGRTLTPDELDNLLPVL